MSGIGSGLRLLAAATIAALLGSGLIGAWGAAQTYLADFSIFTPAESFRLVFVYSLLLSWPAVAVAMAVFAPLTNRFVAEQGPRRFGVVLVIGAVGGIVLAVPVAALLMDGQIWAAIPVGLIYGLSSAGAGLLILPRPSAGGDIA